jgi:hypothetical protein
MTLTGTGVVLAATVGGLEDGDRFTEPVCTVTEHEARAAASTTRAPIERLAQWPE